MSTYEELLDKYKDKGIIYKNNDNIYISKEFPNKEEEAKSYNAIWKRSSSHMLTKKYEGTILNLITNLIGSEIKNVLEIGAGFGNLAYSIIDNICVNTYCCYEFSNAYRYIKKPKKSTCNLKVYNKTFQYLTEKDLKEYQLIVATEIFEHINWDLEFISKLKRSTILAVTIPTFPAKNHVRFFPVIESIYCRYKNYLDIIPTPTCIKKGNKLRWWCFLARRK